MCFKNIFNYLSEGLKGRQIPGMLKVHSCTKTKTWLVALLKAKNCPAGFLNFPKKAPVVGTNGPSCLCLE